MGLVGPSLDLGAGLTGLLLGILLGPLLRLLGLLLGPLLILLGLLLRSLLLCAGKRCQGECCRENCGGKGDALFHGCLQRVWACVLDDICLTRKRS